jgi:hypothetical protein
MARKTSADLLTFPRRAGRSHVVFVILSEAKDLVGSENVRTLENGAPCATNGSRKTGRSKDPSLRSG